MLWRLTTRLLRLLPLPQNVEHRPVRPAPSLRVRLHVEGLEERVVPAPLMMPTESTFPNASGVWNYLYFGEEAPAPYNDPGVLAYATYLRHLQENSQPLPPYVIQVFNDDNGTGFSTVVPIDVNGEPWSGAVFQETTDQLFLPKYQEFQGQVATFSAVSASAEDLQATVFWGDGTKSAGTIVDEGGGDFSVTGHHAWGVDGTYAVVVLVTLATTDAESNVSYSVVDVESTPAFVFDLKDPTVPRCSASPTWTSTAPPT